MTADISKIAPTRQVTSFYAMAWLVVNGRLPCEAIPGTTVVLVFDDSDGQASALLRQWYHDPCPVDARDYVAAFSQVRDLVYGRKTAATVPGGTP